jgi:hypothetical protein
MMPERDGVARRLRVEGTGGSPEVLLRRFEDGGLIAPRAMLVRSAASGRDTSLPILSERC